MKFGTREDGSTIRISSFEDKAEPGALEPREQIGLAPFLLAKEMKGYSTHACDRIGICCTLFCTLPDASIRDHYSSQGFLGMVAATAALRRLRPVV
jgi:hypothetical protein